jgi:hypothetical protein
MLPRLITTRGSLTAASKPTARRCYAANQNGSKLGAAETSRRRFGRLQTVVADVKLSALFWSGTNNTLDYGLIQ